MRVLNLMGRIILAVAESHAVVGLIFLGASLALPAAIAPRGRLVEFWQHPDLGAWSYVGFCLLAGISVVIAGTCHGWALRYGESRNRMFRKLAEVMNG